MRHINRASRVPPWQQVANSLRAEIEAGVFDPDGPPLPSVNRLSQEWGIARRTAHRALQELAKEGLIEAVPGLGYFAVSR